MKIKSIKLQQTESTLKRAIPEAFAQLGDPLLSSLLVTDVDCSRGKYDAKVYLDPSFYTPQEKKHILKTLPKMSGRIKTFISNEQGWYRSPDFRYYFDDALEQRAKMESLFEKISKELEGKKDGK